jgi:hypothetical protein
METKQLVQHKSDSTLVAYQATKQLVEFGQKQGWQLNVIGQAPMLEEPIRLKDWLLVPAHEDTSEIPFRALQRVQSLFAAGIRPKGFVVVHEAPRVLPAGEPVKLPKPFPVGNVEFGKVLSTAGKVVAAAATAVAALSGLALLSGLMVGAAVLDPILIAVTDDDYWVEIDRWYS